uniref:Seven TM Receptor n=1 Tax=Caenorhabditis tropicalis TaxID=1561998 RepID=A0A1I7TR39_9PELO
MRFFRGWKSVIWLFYCLFFAALWHSGVYWLLKSDDVTSNYFREELRKRYNVNSDELPLRAFMAYDPHDHSIRLRNWLFTVLVTSIMAFQYGVMMYCGWQMHSKMEEKIKNLSAALQHHHKQLFKTLVFQITTPTIFLFSPLVLVIYLPFFNIELSFPAGATVCAFNFYPALDVFIVFYVVTEYRTATKRLFKGLLTRMGMKVQTETRNYSQATATNRISPLTTD